MITDLTHERAETIFREAAQEIGRKGWTQHDREGTTGLTIDVAICAVTHGIEDGQVSWGRHEWECEQASDRMLGYLLATGEMRLGSSRRDSGDIIASWNDERSRTREEVLWVLREAAEAMAALRRRSEGAAGWDAPLPRGVR
jgi:hypothetical protein